jgi:hypothetical protein
MASPLYPTEVNVNQKDIDVLTRTFKQAYKDIVGTINGSTSFSVSNRKSILAQIEAILESLGVDVQDFVEREMTNQYKSGAGDAVKQLNNVDAELPIKTGFSQVHKDAIDFLVNETTQSMFEAISGVKRSANVLLGRTARELITQKMATGITAGSELNNVKRILKGILAEQGLDSVTDKSGRGWSLDRYSEMLFRTKAVQARNYGFANRLVENGYDLVQVSSHFSSCPLCEPWQGKILSVTGKTKGYPTLAQAESDGLFHPNCRHAINAITPSLANKTRAYDPEKKTLTDPGQTIQKPVFEQVQKQVKKAEEVDQSFKDAVSRISDEFGYEFRGGKVKTASRATEKIINDYDGLISEIKDLNRGVIFIDDPAKVDVLVERVRKTYKVERVKNDFGDYVGYQKAMINVHLESGNIAEIQVTTKEFWRAKKELGGDDLYHLARVQAEGWEEAENKMNELYSNALQELKARLNAS